MPPRITSTNNYASMTAAPLPPGQASGTVRYDGRDDSRAPQVQPGQVGTQPSAALTGHDPLLLEQKMQGAMPDGRLEGIIKELQDLIAVLRRSYVPAAPENAVTANHAHQAHRPDQQPDQPAPEKTPMAHAISRIGMGALAGAGLTAGACGLMGIGGLAFLGATAAVFGVASYGLLGAGLWAGYKYHTNLLASHQNNPRQMPPPAYSQHAGSGVPGYYLPAVQRSNRAHDPAGMRTD